MADETLIKNLESQLERLVEQSADLEECKYVLCSQKFIQ